jgi:hypothetical protein
MSLWRAKEDVLAVDQEPAAVAAVVARVYQTLDPAPLPPHLAAALARRRAVVVVSVIAAAV